MSLTAIRKALGTARALIGCRLGMARVMDTLVQKGGSRREIGIGRCGSFVDKNPSLGGLNEVTTRGAGNNDHCEDC